MYILWVLVPLSSISSISLTYWFSLIFFSESRKAFSWSNCNSWVFMSPTVGCLLLTLKVQQDNVQYPLSKQCSEGEHFPQQGRGSVLEWKSPSLNVPLASPFLREPVFSCLRHSLHGWSAVNCKSCFCLGVATAPFPPSGSCVLWRIVPPAGKHIQKGTGDCQEWKLGAGMLSIQTSLKRSSWEVAVSLIGKRIEAGQGHDSASESAGAAFRCSVLLLFATPSLLPAMGQLRPFTAASFRSQSHSSL